MQKTNIDSFARNINNEIMSSVDTRMPDVNMFAKVQAIILAADASIVQRARLLLGFHGYIFSRILICHFLADDANRLRS